MITKVNFFPHTYGLVVCGGNSSRMGRDKSLLRYHDKPQRYHVYDMLLPFCEKVFISCNAEQANAMARGYPFIQDLPQYNNTGPMAALLTAAEQFPKTNFLFIGCDYPFLTNEDLVHFFSFYKEEKPLSFYNADENMYEPLLAYYPHSSFSELKKRYEAKQYSLQHFLQESKADKFYPVNKKTMSSIDTEEAFIKAFNSINR
jgi:molybdopterin-guanine dinucleotide biosynthesis protein A